MMSVGVWGIRCPASEVVVNSHGGFPVSTLDLLSLDGSLGESLGHVIEIQGLFLCALFWWSVGFFGGG